MSDDENTEGHESTFNVADLPGFRGHVIPVTEFPLETWPGTVDLEGIEPLSPEQDARASAVHHARQALERRGGALQNASSSTPPSVDQIIRLANWIITGQDPL